MFQQPMSKTAAAGSDHLEQVKGTSEVEPPSSNPLQRAMLVSEPDLDAPQGDADDAAERTELFIRLLGQNHRSLHLYVMSLIPNRTDAEDVLQQTQLVLWREFH